ncbi:class I SAM-dependent methyltransferase [Magnetospirillum moscoviense]|uniref:SAM-dependent methyltransferase n=1 Tax=Magnetospirillum moscoviense TaxID=1437059 RepID=A0A178M9D3_9PROT|nr:class I SAM-dependent methyltransferase [Magnetospirillum moscoviense]OAN45391.1 SAM-dependent methyltransferase [Magnetospirillum moscoviense]
MAEFNFIQKLHSSTKRDYVARVVEADKAECARVAQQWGQDYWDGERRFGYGGYRYDGRWRPVAEELARHLKLKPGMRLLDVGCGKGFLLYEFTQVVPGLVVAGLDISAYAIDNAKPEIKPFLSVGDAASLPYGDGEFDAVVSLGCLHNLNLPDLWRAVGELQRVCPGTAKYVMVESFRDEREKANLLYWQLTCRSFHDPQSWAWLFGQAGYGGDWGFIFFE